MNTEREAILAQVKTDLLAIDGNSPYTTTVRAVSRNLISANGMLVTAGVPGIAIVDKGDEPEGVASHQERSMQLNLALGLCMKQQPGEGVVTDLNKFVGDVIYAMTAPTKVTHSNTCIFTWHKGTTVYATEGDGLVWAVVDFSITYVNTWSAP